MKPEIILTKDGSHTLFVPSLNEHYHSVFGAIQESEYIFIGKGFREVESSSGEVSLLEVGFGTGLNALLTLLEAERRKRKVNYVALEAYPLPTEVWSELNYPRILCPGDTTRIFERLHTTEWGVGSQLSDYFRFTKIRCALETFEPPEQYFDLVYFDSFSPQAQPGMWTTGIFHKIYRACKPGAVMITYSAKGDVRRSMKTAGFRVTRLPGPPGKHHITRAVR